MGTARGVLWLLLLAVVPAVVTGAFHPRSPWGAQDDPLAIKITEAIVLPDILWLDARSASTYEQAHIPGALPLNEDDWEALIDAVLLAWRPEATVVVYCDGTGCDASRSVAARLREEMQEESIYYLAGGWSAWQSEHEQ